MFKIIKKGIQAKEPVFDMDVAKIDLIAGMVGDTVFDIPSAVKVTGAKNGDQIGALYKELEQELQTLSHEADRLAAEGKTNMQIINGVNLQATNFNANDIRTMKEEEYGSIIMESSDAGKEGVSMKIKYAGKYDGIFVKSIGWFYRNEIREMDGIYSEYLLNMSRSFKCVEV